MRALNRAVSWKLGITFLLSIIVATLWFAWETRSAAIPSIYHAEGVWGRSALILRPDHTLSQDVEFMEYDRPSVPPYPMHVTFHKTISGRWEEYGRSWFDQKIDIKPFISLIRLDRGKVYDDFTALFGPVALTGLGIEIDIGDGVVYRK